MRSKNTINFGYYENKRNENTVIEALKVGVWVDSGSVYSGFKNTSVSSLYSGINREVGGSDYVAHIGSSQAFVMDIPSDVNSTYYTVKNSCIHFQDRK